MALIPLGHSGVPTSDRKPPKATQTSAKSAPGPVQSVKPTQVVTEKKKKGAAKP